jgi:hypothetical protein
VRTRGQRPEDLDWFISSESLHRDPAGQMDAAIHTEQRLTALHKVYGTPLGREYVEVLGRCVRINAQLGFVDAGLPMARKLADLVGAGNGCSVEVAASAYTSLLVLAHVCRRAGRFDEALELDSAARAGMADHRVDHAREWVASVAAVATDHAGLGRLDRAVATLREEVDDPDSTLHRHPLSRPAVRVAAQLRRYQRLQGLSD